MNKKKVDLKHNDLSLTMKTFEDI